MGGTCRPVVEIPVDFSAALDKITGRVDNPCICFTCQLSGQNAAKKEKNWQVDQKELPYI
ncbi:hypothetical protein VU05_05375 [Desulfobulbus sp. F1]|nr:hypothetical protein [Desulfobulbus sp. F1]